jgi:phosphoglycerate dehydrogenase-like enzyme
MFFWKLVLVLQTLRYRECLLGNTIESHLYTSDWTFTTVLAWIIMNVLGSVGRRMSAKRAKTDGKLIAFVCPETDEGVLGIPEHLRARIVASNDINKFNPETIACVAWKPPGKAQVVEELFAKIEKATGAPPPWFHSFYAGVDGLGPFLKKLDTTKTKTTNGRGAFSSSLGEWSVACMFHFNKQIPRLLQNYQEKRWDAFYMDTILGKTVGFLGFGSIAQATTHLLQPFGVKMIATKRNAEGTEGPHGIEFVSKLDCAKRADFIVNALPHTPETRNFADAEFFDNMKPSAVFINVGRGATVDEDALADALTAGKIRGAALDVFKVEPLPQNHKFYSTPNMLLSNHNADHTEDYIPLGWQVFEHNLKWFENDFKAPSAAAQPPTCFKPETGY